MSYSADNFRFLYDETKYGHRRCICLCSLSYKGRSTNRYILSVATCNPIDQFRKATARYITTGRAKKLAERYTHSSMPDAVKFTATLIPARICDALTSETARKEIELRVGATNINFVILNKMLDSLQKVAKPGAKVAEIKFAVGGIDNSPPVKKTV